MPIRTGRDAEPEGNAEKPVAAPEPDAEPKLMCTAPGVRP